MPSASPLSLSPLVERVQAALPGQEIYLVGGAVRDALLGKLSHDLDFVVPEEAIAAARSVANSLHADFYILDESFDAARVIVRSTGVKDSRDFLDFTSFRWLKGAPAAKAIEADLRARDFTINAIAYDLRTGSMLDPLKGAADLRAKVLRACSTSSMSDDAIRVLRGVRLAATLQFRIEAETQEAMKAAASLLPLISPERRRDELFKILEGPRADASVRVLEALGVFPYFLPELAAMKAVKQSAPHVDDVWEHTLSVLQYLDGILSTLSAVATENKNSDLLSGLLSLRLGRYRAQLAEHFATSLNPDRSMRGLLFLAALYHDVSKPDTRTVDENGRIRFLGHDVAGAEVAARRARSLNLSNDEVERLGAIILHHMRFHYHVSRMERDGKEPSRKSIYRFFRDAGEAGVDLILLGLADQRGTRGHLLTQDMWSKALDVARIFLENYWEKPEETVAPPRLVDGNEIMQVFELKPGPVIGHVLDAIREAQAAGEVSTREEAVEYGRKWLTNNA